MMRLTKRLCLHLSMAVLLCSICETALSQETRRGEWLDVRAMSIERATSEFIQIPGPNPILVPGPKGAWDSRVIEASDVFKDHDTYYFYYHATGRGSGYQLGVATAGHPLGPWKKYEKNPVLERGPKGSWEESYVACAYIVKEKTNKYYMWYSGYGSDHKWAIGLATASSPLGPWKKYEKNPIMDDFGYVGGVVKYQGQYYLYTAHPIGSTGADYSPMSLAIADKPEGPYTEYEGNPVLKQGPWGSWDDGGYSEAEVFFHDGVFHMFYGGTKLHPTRILSRESIGYAYSFDGKHFTKHPRNPVAIREMVPDGAAFAEVHALPEGSFIYLFHTLRYNSRQGAEDLGIQVLATQRPFKLRMPILIEESLGAGEITSLKQSQPVCLDNLTTLALTVEATFTSNASSSARIHVLTSFDGLNYDTIDYLQQVVLTCTPGETVRKTFEVKPIVKYLKVRVENSDTSEPVKNLSVYATMGG